MKIFQDIMLVSSNGNQFFSESDIVALSQSDGDISRRYSTILAEEEEKVANLLARKYSSKQLDPTPNVDDLTFPVSECDPVKIRFLNYCEESDDDEGIVMDDNSEAKLQAGIDFCHKGQLGRSKFLLKQVLKQNIDGNDYQITARALGNLGNVYEALNCSEKAADRYLISIDLLHEAGDYNRERFMISNAIFSFVGLKMFDKAIMLANKQIEIARLVQFSANHHQVYELNKVIEEYTKFIFDVENAVQLGQDFSLDSETDRHAFVVRCVN